MASARDNNDFMNEIMDTYPLDTAIVWLRTNMTPEDVFDEAELIAWAEENGFLKDE